MTAIALASMNYLVGLENFDISANQFLLSPAKSGLDSRFCPVPSPFAGIVPRLQSVLDRGEYLLRRIVQ